MAKASPTQAWLWHRKLSHLNFDYITLLSKKDVVNGLPKLKYVKDKLCSSCEMMSIVEPKNFKEAMALILHGIKQCRKNELHQFYRLKVWENTRLVAKVMLRKRVIDFEESFAQLLAWKCSDFRCLRRHRFFQFYQMDVKTGISIWTTEGGRFCAQPEGFVDPDSSRTSLLLRKAL
ncbi:retrovirus-related pol polyprotein from transposon TNT 1-94 [Tanacetum coccineum]